MPKPPHASEKKRIEIWIDETLKDAFISYCVERDVTVPAFLRKVIIALLEKNGTSIDVKKKQRKTNKITINLTQEEVDEIEVRYDLEGYETRSEWVSSLVRSSLHKEAVLTRDEMTVLRESNSLLRSLGVNLNQIALAMNTEVKEKGEVSELLKRRVSPALLIHLRDFVVEHTAKSQALIAKNIKRFQ